MMAAIYLAAIVLAACFVPPTVGQGYGGAPVKGKKHRTTTTTLPPPGQEFPLQPDYSNGNPPQPGTNSVSGNLVQPGGSPDAGGADSYWWSKGENPFSGATANLSPPGPAPPGVGGQPQQPQQPYQPGADNPFLSGVRPSGGCGGGTGCGQPSQPGGVNIEGNPFLSGLKPQQPSRVVCSGPGSVCVPRNLCSNGVVIPNEQGIVQRGSGVHECDAATQLCCRLPSAPTVGCDGAYGGCSGGNQPQQPGLIHGNNNGNPQQPGLVHGKNNGVPQQPGLVHGNNNGVPQQPGLVHGTNNGVPQVPINPGGQNPNYVPGGSSISGQYYPGTNGVPIGGSIHDRPVTSAPDRPYTGPQNTTPYPGCAAALKCVQEIYCTAIGVMSNQPVHLTRDQQENRVPLAVCADPDTGVVGKCCRDPNYKDPWPGGMMMPGGPPHQHNQQADQCGPSAACTPGYLCADHNKIQPIQNCQVPLDGASGMCCTSGQPSQQGGQYYPGTSPLPPINNVRPGGSNPGQTFPGQNPQGSPTYPGQNTQPFPGQNTQQPFPGQNTQPGGIHPGQNTQQPFPGPNTQPGGIHPGQNAQPFPGQNTQQPFPGPNTQPGGIHPGQNVQPFPGHNAQPFPGQNAQPSGINPGQNLQPFPGQNVKPSGVHPGPSYPSGVQNPQPSNQQFEPAHLLPIPSTPVVPNPFPNRQTPISQQPNVPGNVPNYQQPGHLSPAPGQACGIRRQVPKQGLSDIDAGFGEFPWQAIVTNNRNRTNLCSAAIITDQAVITSAQCLQKFQAGDLSVKAGAWKLDSHDQPQPIQTSSVAAIARHPNYDARSLFNDLAILLLAQPLRLNDHVDTICLPSSSVPNLHGPWVATGWEKKALQNNVPNSILHQIPVNYVPHDQCQENLRSTNLGRHFKLNKSFSCAVPTQPNQDLCKVSVGSPVAQDRGDGSYELSGLYSWDVGCTNANPKVFSSIDANWVQNVLKKPASQVMREEQESLQREEQQESVEGIDLDSKPGFSQGYGRK